MEDHFLVTEKAAKQATDKDTTTTTIRVDKSLVAKYDELAQKSQRSRNELICMAMEFALEHLVFVPNESK